MSQLSYALPAETLRDYVSVYYLFACDDTHFIDGERAAIAQLRFFVGAGGGTMYFANGRSDHCTGAFIIGPTTGAVRFECPGPFRIFGLGLLAAGWGALTHASAADFTDRAVPAEQLFPSIARYQQTLATLKDLPEMAQAANEVLAPFIARADPNLLGFTHMVDGWLASDVSPMVGELHELSRLSERQLTRRVKQLYGMPPKYLSRKYRALRAARALIEADPDEADFLRDAFYDQSHMIRELKLFTGTTPNRLRTGESELASMIDQRSSLAGAISPLTADT